MMPPVQAGQALIQGFLALLAPEGGTAADLGVWAQRSQRVAALQAEYLRKQSELWTATLRRQQGGGSYAPVAEPDPGDRRFASPEWRDNPYYDYVKQQYLLGARFLTQLVEAAEADEKTRQRLRFFARQYADML